MATLRATRQAFFCGFAWLVALATPLAAAPQQSAPAPPTSIDRIKEDLARKGQRLKLDVAIPPARPTFKSRVDQRQFVLTLEQALHRDFDLNELQRQSANWAAMGSGYDLSLLFNAIDRAMVERKIRKTREQIAQELAFIEAAREAARVAAAKVK